MNYMYNIATKRNGRFYSALFAVCMLLGLMAPNVLAQETSNTADITGR